MIKVSYNYLSAYDAGIRCHAEKQMHNLGIKYYHAIPQSIGDCYWFWIDDDIELPDYIYIMEYAEPIP